MNYEGFKREMRRNALWREGDWDRKIHIIDKSCICSDPETLQIIRLCNLDMNGLTDMIVPEDMLCMEWKTPGGRYVVHWKMQDLYKRFQVAGWEGVIPNINRYVQMCDKLIIRPVPATGHESHEKNSICWRFHDILLTLYTRIYEGEGEAVDVECPRELTEGWGISDMQLLTNAIRHCRIMMPPRILWGRDLWYHEEMYRSVLAYVLSTSGGKYGSVALFYPGVQNRIAKLMQGDYYVGFYNVHEVVLYSVEEKSLSELQTELARHQAVQDAKLFLSGKIFRYVCSKAQLIEV